MLNGSEDQDFTLGALSRAPAYAVSQDERNVGIFRPEYLMNLGSIDFLGVGVLGRSAIWLYILFWFTLMVDAVLCYDSKSPAT